MPQERSEMIKSEKERVRQERKDNTKEVSALRKKYAEESGEKEKGRFGSLKREEAKSLQYFERCLEVRVQLLKEHGGRRRNKCSY